MILTVAKQMLLLPVTIAFITSNACSFCLRAMNGLLRTSVFTTLLLWSIVLVLLEAAGGQIRAGDTSNEFAVTDASLFFSPYNTYSDGSGRLLPTNIRAGSTFALWNHPGSYLKTDFRGSSATLLLDIRSINEGGMPRISWSVDNGPLQVASLERDVRSLPLARSLPSARHTLAVYLTTTDANFDRWETPIEAVKIMGIRLDPGGKLLPPTGSVGIFPGNTIFFGDSITEGAWTLGNSNRLIGGRYVDWVAHSDAVEAWPTLVAAALGSEYGNCGSASMSWISPARPAYLPPLPKAWDVYFSGHSRLIGGKLAPMPDYVIVNMGTNDGDRDTTAAILSWLRAVRSAVNRKTPVLVMIPFGQQNRESITRAISAGNDRFVIKIDLGPRWSRGLNHYGTPSLVAYDGLHPKASASGLYAALVTAAIKDGLHGVSKSAK